MDSIQRFFTYLAILVLFFMIFRLGRTALDTYQTQSRIDVLAEEIELLEQENQLYEEEIGYRQSQEFVEKEARDRLHLIKPGETVVVVEENETNESQVLAGFEKKESKTIPEQWQSLIFGW